MRYEISNQPFTVATLQLEKGETVKCQSGAMAWMSPGISMETKTGDFGSIFKKCADVTAKYKERSRAMRMGEALLRLLAPLL